MTRPEVLTWVLLTRWGNISSSSAFDFYHLVGWCIWSDRHLVKIPEGPEHHCPFMQVSQTAGNSGFGSSESLVSKHLGFVWNTHQESGCFQWILAGCPGWSQAVVLHTLLLWPTEHVLCIKGIFIWKKIASPRWTEKAWLQIRYERVTRLLPSEAGGKPDPHWQVYLFQSNGNVALFPFRAFLDRCQASLPWEDRFCPFLLD